MSNETLADILAAMRAGVVPPHQRNEELLAYLADRIEAAATRECEVVAKNALKITCEICERQTPPGDAAAMRAALVAINCINTGGLKSLLWQLVEADIFDGGLINKTISAIEKARSALAAPPRNCDVGTAEEQSARMAEFCRAQYEKSDGVLLCSRCQFNGRDCQFAWAQMPYEAEGGAK